MIVLFHYPFSSVNKFVYFTMNLRNDIKLNVFCSKVHRRLTYHVVFFTCFLLFVHIEDRMLLDIRKQKRKGELPSFNS